MKTTIELPDELLIAAKKQAAETRSTLREIVERALRRELAAGKKQVPGRRRRLHWTTVEGPLPPDLDLSSREKVWEWFDKHDRRRY